MMEFFEEFWDEISDFFEDFWELLSRRRESKPKTMKHAEVGGVVVAVRPAYLFAERIDNLLKFVFGISISVSAVTSTFLGYTKLSDLLDVLIGSVPGRFAMFVIGMSYLITAAWKLMRIRETP